MNEKNTLFIDRKTAARLSAGLIVGFFALFTTGYFTGKRHALQEIAVQTQNESFNDHITTAIDTMYQPQQCTYYDPFDSQQQEEFAQEAPEIQQAHVEQQSEPSARYYAELVGFGARRNAEAFVEKMNGQNIDVRLQDRTSTTKSGKTITWFQILSPQFTEKETLNEFISTIKQHEKLHDIRVREIFA